MQVDEPADDHTNPSTPERPILPPTVTQSRVSIPEKAVQGVCKQLERYILPGDDDNSIREDLNIVWIVVHDALSQAQTLRARLADQDEFQENVQKYGEKEFIELLRDMAKRKNWRDLLENGTSIPCV
jgi:hypothetical protein